MRTQSIIIRSKLGESIPVCLSIMDQHVSADLHDHLPVDFSMETLARAIEESINGRDSGFLPDLARLEFIFNNLKNNPHEFKEVTSTVINPTLHMIETAWRGLREKIYNMDSAVNPAPGKREILLVYRDPTGGEAEIRTADPGDVLALKIIAEDISHEELKKTFGLTPRNYDDLMESACDRGIILKPKSLIVRDPVKFPAGKDISPEYFYSEFFTLQWHITQACDLHCRHCYDRSSREQPDLARGLEIIREFREFCDSRNVRGQITFTGGNPLLHPAFHDFYMEAGEKGLLRAILGNPSTGNEMERLLESGMPEFYQVSLEGLEEHNDYIRGDGHFKRTIEFLEILKDLGIYSMVMLTLTRDNIDQVIPLAEILRNRTDRFNFSRLALFGEGAGLALPENNKYAAFLEEYTAAAQENPVMGLKDSLINIVKKRAGQELFGGCASYGCGAAFNFVALLPDGEVHACRKMPSMLGNLNSESLASIYDSSLAARYRLGTSACAGCEIRPVCGGCPAVTLSNGLDIFKDRDPMCFLESDI